MLLAPLLFAIAATSSTARCDALERAVAETAGDAPDVGAVARAAALLPPALSARIATEAGRASPQQSARLLARAAALTCPPPATATTTTLAVDDLKALVDNDPRFGGLRTDTDLGAKLVERVLAFLESLLQSEVLQRFSENTRTIYLTVLALGLAVVGFRLWRQSKRRAAGGGGDADVVVAVERARKNAFDALRREGLAIIDTDPRSAMLQLRRALLVRVGEVDTGAVHPSRTSTEVLSHLPETIATVVAPALHRFDRAFFGDAADAAGAHALLAAVDAAHAALEGLKTSKRRGGP